MHVSCNILFNPCPHKCPGNLKYNPPSGNGKLKLCCASRLYRHNPGVFYHMITRKVTRRGKRGREMRRRRREQDLQEKRKCRSGSGLRCYLSHLGTSATSKEDPGILCQRSDPKM